MANSRNSTKQIHHSLLEGAAMQISGSNQAAHGRTEFIIGEATLLATTALFIANLVSNPFTTFGLVCYCAGGSLGGMLTIDGIRNIATGDALTKEGQALSTIDQHHATNEMPRLK